MIEEWTNITRTIHTPEGDLVIFGVTSPETLEKLSINDGLKAFRPANKQKKALIEISRLDRGKIVSAQINGELVGYISFHPPDEFERWSQGPNNVLELGAIEVTLRFRHFGVAQNMLIAAFQDEKMEEYIVLATEYYWHWDLENIPIYEYREMMFRLMNHVGLITKETNDDEIISHPANMLMVRYGRNVSKEAIRAFDDLMFLYD